MMYSKLSYIHVQSTVLKYDSSIWSCIQWNLVHVCGQSVYTLYILFITLQKKKFEIRALEGRKFTYYTGSDDRSKHLWSLCRSTHLFQMTVQPKLAEIRHLHAEDQRRYREKLVTSDPDERTSLHSRLSLPPHRLQSGGGTLEQRVSVISNASSNTTSGIVSDRMHISFDESEGIYLFWNFFKV